MVQDLKHLLDNLESSLKTLEKPAEEKGKQFGIIQSYKDGVIEIKGLTNLRMGDVVQVQNTDIQALVMNLEQDRTYALVLQRGGGLKEGLMVEALNRSLSIGVDEKLIGRIIDPLGTPLDGKDPIETNNLAPLEKIAPGVMTRKSVHQPVQTGILVVDALIPIGRGQRELIIGDRQTGKTTIAIDTILNQHDQDMICIYVAIGQKEAKVARVYETLKAHGAMDYTLIVDASASKSAALQFLAPYAGSAIAEYFLEKGKDVLIIYDDLSKHAVAYREMSLLLRRPPGREAYPGDIFYCHSRLLERAVKLNEANGGGSITALPIIETLAGDVSSYIPTNVISITDGQIFLDTNLFNKGVRPAVDVGISVSRVGGSAQTKVIKKIAGTTKLELAQFYELEAFSQFASDLDDATKQLLLRGRRIIEVLKQKNSAPYALWKQVALLYAVNNGYFDKYDKKKVHANIDSLLLGMESSHKEVIKEIEDEKELSDAVKEGLEKACTSILS